MLLYANFCKLDDDDDDEPHPLLGLRGLNAGGYIGDN